MTTSARSKRRVYSGATRTPTSNPPSADRFSYRDLHPEMYKGKPLRPKPAQFDDAIRKWLREHGEATASEIASGLCFSDSRHTSDRLFNGVAGVVVVGEKRGGRGRIAKVWGLV